MGYLLKYVLQTLPLYCIVLVVVYIVGALLNKVLHIFNNRGSSLVERVFYNCFTGLVSLFVGYAVIASKGISVFSPLLGLLTIYYFTISKKEDGQIGPSSIPAPIDYAAIAAVAIGCYAWAFFLTMPDNVSGVIHTYYDYSYYANTAEGMAKTGVEYSKQAMYQFESFKGSFLYHYPDLWLTALLVNVSHINSMPALLYVVYPLFMFIAFAGCIVLAKTVAGGRISTNILYLITPAILGGVLLAKNSTIAKNLMPGMGSGIDQYLFHWLDKKMLIIYIIATIALLQLLKHNYEAFFAAMLTGMYLYATVVPAVAGGLVCVLGVLFLFDKAVGFKRAMLLAAMYVVALVTIVLFDKYTSAYPRPALDAVAIPGIKSLIILVLEFGVKIAVGALPAIAALVALWYISRKKLEPYMYYMLVFLIGACGATALFISLNHTVTDINQALYTSIPVYISLFALIIFVKLFIYIRQKPAQIALLLVLVLSTGFKIYGNVKGKHQQAQLKYNTAFETVVFNTVKTDVDAKIGILGSDTKHDRWYYHFNAVGSFTGQAAHVGEPLYIHPYFNGDSVRHAFWALPNNIDDPTKNWFDDRQKEGEATDIRSYLKSNAITYLFAERADMLRQYNLEDVATPLYTDKNTGQIFCSVSR